MAVATTGFMPTESLEGHIKKFQSASTVDFVQYQLLRASTNRWLWITGVS